MRALAILSTSPDADYPQKVLQSLSRLDRKRSYTLAGKETEPGSASSCDDSIRLTIDNSVEKLFSQSQNILVTDDNTSADSLARNIIDFFQFHEKPAIAKTTIEDIFTRKGYDKQKLSALAELFYLTGVLDNGILKDTPPTPDELNAILSRSITATDLNSLLQTHYFNKYRANGIERQQMGQDSGLASHRDNIISLFKTLGYVDAVSPSRGEYDIAFIYGEAENEVRNRIMTLKKLNEGTLLSQHTTPVQTAHVYILAGDRKLWPVHEPLAVTLAAHRANVDEAEIKTMVDQFFTPEVIKKRDPIEVGTKKEEVIQAFEKQYSVTWPTEVDMAEQLAKELFADRPVSIVAATGKNGKRADTLDTVEAWDEKFGHLIKTKKSIIAISNQPYIPEQSVPLGVLDPKQFHCEVVGNAYDDKHIKPEALLVAFAGGFYKAEIQLKQFKAMAAQQEQGASTLKR